MSVLAYIELGDNKVKKAAFEAASYAAATAQKMGTEAIGVALGTASAADLEALGAYGLKQVMHVNSEHFNSLDSQAFTQVVGQIAEQAGADVVVFSHGYTGKTMAPRMAAKMNAGLVAGATALPELDGGFIVQKTAFSNKGFAKVKINTPNKVISLAPNAYGAHKGDGTAAVVAVDLGGSITQNVRVKETVKLSDTIPLTEADLVVSAGRGLKGPENWGMVEDLAGLLGAATACSRAVSDVHWRPHHEHVGQTGITVSPNLYIAIAISGAIQHLAGVSSSKTIVVINKDPEAPFFKAADYGIVGDAFEVVPKLVEEMKKFKGA